MKKQQIEIIITGILIVVLVFVVFANTKRRHGSSSSVGKGGMTMAARGSDAPWSGRENAVKQLKARSSAIRWGRDPFLSAQKPVLRQGTLRLQGIVADAGGAKAIINGAIIGVGDRVEGYTVSEIREDGVILSDGQQSIELRL